MFYLFSITHTFKGTQRPSFPPTLKDECLEHSFKATLCFHLGGKILERVHLKMGQDVGIFHM